MRVRKFADMHREFAAAARRREIKAENFDKQGCNVSARESYFIAAMLYSAARWPIFENKAKSIEYNTRMVVCYDKFAALMNRPIERVEVPFGGKENRCRVISIFHANPSRGRNFHVSSAS